jgi:hypothetical protein
LRGVVLTWAALIAAAPASTTTSAASFTAFAIITAGLGTFLWAIGNGYVALFRAGLVTLCVFSAFAALSLAVAPSTALAAGTAVRTRFVACAFLRREGCICSRCNGLHVHWLAFGVNAIALCAALAVATSAATTPSATAIAATVATPFWASFGANLAAFATWATTFIPSTIAVAVASVAIAVTYFTGSFRFRAGNDGRRRHRGVCAKE